MSIEAELVMAKGIQWLLLYLAVRHITEEHASCASGS